MAHPETERDKLLRLAQESAVLPPDFYERLKAIASAETQIRPTDNSAVPGGHDALISGNAHGKQKII